MKTKNHALVASCSYRIFFSLINSYIISFLFYNSSSIICCKWMFSSFTTINYIRIFSIYRVLSLDFRPFSSNITLFILFISICIFFNSLLSSSTCIIFLLNSCYSSTLIFFIDSWSSLYFFSFATKVFWWYTMDSWRRRISPLLFYFYKNI